MVFLDECGFSLNLYRFYGWAPSCERCQEDVPFVRVVRGGNRSVLGALSLSGMTALFHKLGAIKRVDFEAFLRDELLPRLPQGSVWVLDNARTHHGGEVAKIVEGAGCSLLYPPPHSPDFSPIELAWSWIEGRVRLEKPRDDEQRQVAIERAVTDLPRDYVKPWFRKCGYSQS